MTVAEAKIWRAASVEMLVLLLVVFARRGEGMQNVTACEGSTTEWLYGGVVCRTDRIVTVCAKVRGQF